MMSGRGGGKKYGGRGRGYQQHRQSVKTTFNNKFQIRRDRKENSGDEDVPMQTTHKISGYNHSANTEVIRTLLLGKVDGLKFLEFSVQDQRIVASVGTKAEALSLQNLSGTMYANKKV